LENLQPHVDGVIALDDQSTDGSAAFVKQHPLVIELLQVPPGGQDELEDGKNHRTLIEAAWEHSPDWLLGIDADERVECSFRELWGAPDRFRVSVQTPVGAITPGRARDCRERWWSGRR